MTTTPPTVKMRKIPIALIDPPEIAMRETMSDEGLEALGDSLRRNGQLQNIGVIVAGDRFRVAFGHRRRVAAERAGLTELECKVWPEGTPDEEALKVDENDQQEPVNAVAEATYYHELYERKCGQDADRVAALVRRPLSRVLDRLHILRWDPEVRQALREGRISIAIGKLLFQVKDDGYRKLFLTDAMRLGATARTVQSWVDDVKRLHRMQEASRDAGLITELPAPPAAIASMDACVLCGTEGDQHEMEYRKVHVSCYRVFRRQQHAPTSAEPPA